MARFFLALAFLISLIALPWWVSVCVAIVYLAEGGNIFVVILGALIFDTLFGAPIARLGGFSHLYTTFAVILSVATYFLRTALFE